MENMTQLIGLFENNINKTKKYSQNTVNSYIADISAFNEYMQSENISSVASVTKRHISLYIKNIISSGRSASTATRHIASLKAFFEFIMSLGYIENNPCNNIPVPKTEKKLPEILTSEEITSLLSAPDTSTLRGKRDKAMLELLYATGMKASEIISLKINDVNTQMGYCICSHNGKNRLIPIGQKAAEAIKLYLGEKTYNKDDFLFSKSSGEPITRQAFWKLLKHYGQKAEIKKEITPATIRHSFAAHMVYNGADISSIQEMLGLSNINALDVYTKLNKKRLLDVYNSCHPRA